MNLRPNVICPSCCHDKCVRGKLGRSDIDDPYPSRIYPAETYGELPVRESLKLVNAKDFYCCLQCGLTWSRVNLDKLKALMVKRPNLTQWRPKEGAAIKGLEQSCPECDSPSCIPGGVDSSWLPPAQTTFHPDRPDYWNESPGMKLKNSIIQCCTSCGLVWDFSDNEAIKGILAKLGVPHGDVPVRKSYAFHLAKWISFLLLSTILAVWISSIN